MLILRDIFVEINAFHADGVVIVICTFITGVWVTVAKWRVEGTIARGLVPLLL